MHPTTGKPMFYADLRQKPVIKLCPMWLPLETSTARRRSSHTGCVQSAMSSKCKMIMNGAIPVMSVIRVIQGIQTDFFHFHTTI